MGLDIAYKSGPFEFLKRPGGIVYDFVSYLAETAEFWNSVSSMSHYTKQDIKKHAEDYCNKEKLSENEKQEIFAWIEQLPWKEDEVTLLFWW